MSKCKQLMWPGMLLTASCLNFAGTVAALSTGEDKGNPFFPLAAASSFMFTFANAYNVITIAMSSPARVVPEPTPPSFAERENQRRAVNDLEMGVN